MIRKISQVDFITFYNNPREKEWSIVLFLVVRKENMKTKILLLAMIISMCGGTSDEGNEKNIISLSTTHTEIIQMLEAENQLIGVDSSIY